MYQMYPNPIPLSRKGNQRMKLTITSMAGNTRNINLESKQQVLDFIELFKATLQPSQRVKVTCDVLSIDGYIQGG